MEIYKFNLNEHFSHLGGDVELTHVKCFINQNRETLWGKAKPYPCIVICPGGGYNGISPREADPIALHFASEGYQTFVVHYSVKPHCFPQQLRDVAAAMEIIAEHAEEWECDMNKIAIMGFSAGGHLAAQYSNRFDCPEIRKLFPDSKPVQCTVLGYPVVTADTKVGHGETITNFVGHEIIDQNENGCSCEYLVTEKTPPTFIWHTAEDSVVNVENSLIYAKALRKHMVPFELHIYPYGEHGLTTVDDFTNPEVDEKVFLAHSWLSECKKWLKASL